LQYIAKKEIMANERKNATRQVKGETHKEREQMRPQSRRTEKMPVKGPDPDKKLEQGKTPESGKRAS
jgi:hypothetical protein